MAGAMKTTPIKELETATGLQSLGDRRNIKLLTQAAKFKRMHDHPMHSRMSKPTKGRLKRSSFIQQSRMLERRHPELLDHMPQPIPSTLSTPSWESAKFPIIRDGIPGIGNKGSQSDQERKSLTLEFTQSSYPQEQWTHTYTDGSATEATRDGGGGVCIQDREENTTYSISTGKYSTNY